MAFKSSSSSNANNNSHGANAVSFSLLSSTVTSPHEGNNESTSSSSDNTSHSQLRSDPAIEEFNNFLTKLKYQRTVQDDDESNICKPALVLTTQEVSKVMANLVGMEKKELKAEPRQIIQRLEGFFKQYFEAAKVSKGSKLVELLQELASNPEFVVFQQVLCNPPKEWIELGLLPVQDKVRMKVVEGQIKKDTQDVLLSRRELKGQIDLGKKELKEVEERRTKMEKRMGADNRRRLEISLESFKSEREKLESLYSNNGTSVREKDVTELLQRFQELKERNTAAKEKLSKLSPQNALPPNIAGANAVLADRKIYLDTLLQQIENHSDLNLSNSAFE